MPWTTTEDPSHTQLCSAKKTVFLYRFSCILRASRDETAFSTPQYGRYHRLVKSDKKKSCHGSYAHVLPSLSACQSKPGHSGFIRPLLLRERAISIYTSFEDFLSAFSLKEAMIHTSSFTQGKRRLNASLIILRPLVRLAAFAVFRPTVTPIRVGSPGRSTNNNRTSSPVSRCPVRNTRSNCHPCLSLTADEKPKFTAD